MKQLGMIDLGAGSVHVVDGDSLRKGDTDIRLYGIDAPEYRQSCNDKHDAEYPCGKQSANALRGLVQGHEVSCTSIETDRYGRAVSVCKIGNLEINGEMVRLGWAGLLPTPVIVFPMCTLRPKREKPNAEFGPVPLKCRKPTARGNGLFVGVWANRKFRIKEWCC